MALVFSGYQDQIGLFFKLDAVYINWKTWLNQMLFALKKCVISVTTFYLLKVSEKVVRPVWNTSSCKCVLCSRVHLFYIHCPVFTFIPIKLGQAYCTKKFLFLYIQAVRAGSSNHMTQSWNSHCTFFFFSTHRSSILKTALPFSVESTLCSTLQTSIYCAFLLLLLWVRCIM